MATATTRSRTLLLSLVFATAPALGKAEDVFEGREGCPILQEGGATRPLERVGTLCAERVSPCSGRVPRAAAPHSAALLREVTAFAMLVRGEEAFGPLARRLTEVQLRKRGLLAP